MDFWSFTAGLGLGAPLGFGIGALIRSGSDRMRKRRIANQDRKDTYDLYPEHHDYQGPPP